MTRDSISPNPISPRDTRDAFLFSIQHARAGIQTHPLAAIAIWLTPGFSDRQPLFCRTIMILAVLAALVRWLGVRHLRTRAETIQRRDWILLLALPTLFANFLWAAQLGVMLTSGQLDIEVMLALLGSVALAFGCVVSYAPHRRLTLTLLAMHLGVPLVCTFVQRDPLWILLALLLVAFMLYVLRIAMSLHNDYWGAVATRNHLNEARERAEAANHAKDQFLANISHEIRTPLNGIAAPAELLQHSPLPAEHEQLVKLISSSAHTLGELIDDLLDFSKIEAGKLTLAPRPFSVLGLLGDIIGRHRFSAEAKGLLLELSAPLPQDCWLQGDPLRIGQIIDNLLSNAIKFTDTGTIRVEASCENGERKAQLNISISDTGTGIDEAMREKIFQPFVQGDGSMKRRFPGTGLGLSISKRLAEQMQGKLSFISRVNAGTRFTLTVSLPIAAVQAQVAHDDALGVTFTGIHVLVAEDNRVNQQVIKHQLRALGIAADIVDDGAQALAAIENKSYDLIFLDCQMPVLDGYETVARLRQRHDARAHIPVVALTAHALASDVQRALAAGMNDYLSKPVSLPILTRVISQWLRDKDKLAAEQAKTIVPERQLRH